MKHHEREYFVSRLRSGTYLVEYENFVLKIVPPTVEDEFYINKSFMDAFDPKQQLIQQGDQPPLYLACGLIVRGPLVEISDINRNVERLQKKLKMELQICYHLQLVSLWVV